MAIDKKPHSYTRLKSFGSLDPTLAGLGKLVDMACTGRDSARPRWKLKGGPNLWRRYPEEVEKVKEAQHLLIELGPVLVGMKLLEP